MRIFFTFLIPHFILNLLHCGRIKTKQAQNVMRLENITRQQCQSSARVRGCITLSVSLHFLYENKCKNRILTFELQKTEHNQLIITCIQATPIASDVTCEISLHHAAFSCSVEATSVMVTGGPVPTDPPPPAPPLHRESIMMRKSSPL